MNVQINKGLVVDEPWVGYILAGNKSWEMRSQQTAHRGWFALIRKGSGLVVGVAKLIDVGRQLSPDELIATFDKHRIPAADIRSGAVAKWHTPWILAEVTPLERPVPYRHKSGAVTWVVLDDAAVEGIARQMGATRTTAAPVSNQAPEPVKHPAKDADAKTSVGRVLGTVPVTDGNLRNNHLYLRPFFDQFPSDTIGGSNKSELAAKEVSVEWGDALPAFTDIDGQKKFFRNRSMVKAFYDAYNVQPGDEVAVEKLSDYAYRLVHRPWS